MPAQNSSHIFGKPENEDLSFPKDFRSFSKKKGLGLPGNFPRAWREKSETMWNFRNHQQYYQYRGQSCAIFQPKNGSFQGWKTANLPGFRVGHDAGEISWNGEDSIRIPSLKRTASFTAEIEWLEYDRFRLGWPIFRGYVSFRECICQSDPVIQILVSEIRQPFAEVLGTRGPIHNARDQNRLNRFCESYRL